MSTFPPTRDAALARLDAFLPHAGRDYQNRRNHDLPGHAGVSQLSPYLRHRMLTEPEVLRDVRARHSFNDAYKFIHEVCWRTYWKGYLELRPAVWDAYVSDRNAAWNRVQTQSGLRAEWEAACRGETGIDAFDHWARELTETGYMHNHARMWFASIWIFTLRLPWELGADFFLRHLLDGDPASNTLSWRWVAGVQTRGKTYLARASNIRKYTDGRFDPQGLAGSAPALEGYPLPDRGDPPQGGRIPREGRIGLLITEEDLSPGWLLEQFEPRAIATIQTTAHRSHLNVAPQVTDFVSNALTDCTKRLGIDATALQDIAALDAWREAQDLDHVVTSFIPQGPARDALSEADLIQPIRPYDALAWPHATAGFFKFKSVIPDLLDFVGAGEDAAA